MTDASAPTKRRGLGRGLDALFEDSDVRASVLATKFAPPEAQTEAPPARAQNPRNTLNISHLVPGKYQPRHHFDDTQLAQLAASIAAHGIIQPLLVRPIADRPGFYEIIAGERRWRAAQKAQVHDVPVVINDSLSDSDALQLALIENLQREDLNPVDEALGYQRLMDEFTYTQDKLAELLGKSRSHIANMLRLLGLPEVVQKMMVMGSLSAGHARALITTADPVTLAQEVVAKGLSVRETEKLAAVHTVRTSPTAKKKAKSTAKDVNTVLLERELSNQLGLRVEIDSNSKGSGTLKVTFKTLDQLDDVIKRLSSSRTF